MKIDAHQHFWQYKPKRDQWITDEMSVIRADFLPQDLKPHLDKNSIDGCVAVQADQSMSETYFLLDLADKYPFIKGVVGWMDLGSKSPEILLEQLKKYHRLVGFRHVLEGESDGFMIQPDFVRGVKTLSQYGYTYDILIKERQMLETLHFLDLLPEMKLVVDHCAKPNIDSGNPKDWIDPLIQMADFPHVSIKLSGLTTEAEWGKWHAEDLMPYIEAVIDIFGVNRVMFGSDWPVCLLSGDYDNFYTVLKRVLDQLDEEDQTKILGRNAVQFYQLRP